MQNHDGMGYIAKKLNKGTEIEDYPKHKERQNNTDKVIQPLKYTLDIKYSRCCSEIRM